MKTSKKVRQFLVVVLPVLILSCQDFLEIEAPDNKIISETVFSSNETAESAMQGIYNQLTKGYSGGTVQSVTVLSGLSSKILRNVRSTNLVYLEFERHEILPDNIQNLTLWSSAYNIIYLANSLLEGISHSETITKEVKARLEGEAKFIRAFTYFHLVNLYGDIPLLLSTDYQYNSVASQNSEMEIYQQIIMDLEDATELLENEFVNGERLRINQSTAFAFMARVRLYLENWKEAEILSSYIIDQSNTFEIVQDLDKVFLANSKEAIWQLSPIGSGAGTTNTNEGATFIVNPLMPYLTNVSLAEDFPSSFLEDDKRRESWIAYDIGLASFYPYKYKIRISNDDSSEYSMVLRLVEQYFIRAESRVRMGDLEGAIADLNIIRVRAGLEPLNFSNPNISQELVLQTIFEERERELFTEWGHRWFDIKRAEKLNNSIEDNNSNWEKTDYLYPIPANELMKNPNLLQNPGY